MTAEIVTMLRKRYGVNVIEKQIDGETIELVDIDAMTEENFRRYCKRVSDDSRMLLRSA